MSTEKMESNSTVEIRSRSIFAKSKNPITLKFEDVVYKIKSKAKLDPKKKNHRQTERKILKGVSGAVLPGEMLAMMGPSGSGKTTLLTALGGRLGGHLTGDITYNGRPFSSSLNRSIGFVTQDDVLYPHLTVTETLLYTALLRLPNTLTRQEKAAQAEAVMSELGLTVCRNSVIGGGMLRGVSGGERKRVSVGQEMLINPSLLYLDEPTSGLDSTTAQRIVATLSQLTKEGRTVVMTIHQPSSSLFYMFDKVLLLADGSTVYFGKASEAMNYFASIEYAPSVPMNPADFLLDLANGVPSHEALENRAAVKETLFAAYDQHLSVKVKQELMEVSINQINEGVPEKATSQWTTTWWEQFRILLERGLKERKHESFASMKIIEILFVAFISGSLWWKSGGRVQDQVGFLFFVSGFWAFFPVYQAIFTFPQERMMLTKERSSRMYRLSSYFMARMVGDLPMELILPTIFITVTYWMVGLNPKAANFFMTLFSMLLNVLVAQGIGLALGALIMDLKSATTLASVIMLTFMLAGGYFVQKVPSFIAWIKFISLNFNSLKLLASAQFSATDTYQCAAPMITCKVADVPAIALVGLGRQYIAVAILFAMFFFCRIISYLALMRVGVAK